MRTTKFLVVVLVGLYFLLFLFVLFCPCSYQVWSAVGYVICVLALLLSLFFVLTGPTLTRKLMLRSIHQPATETKQAINRIDILHSVYVGVQSRPQPTLFEIEKSSAAPTRHPHHVITHNTQHQIFNVYNRRLSSPAAASTTRLQAVWSHLAGHSEILCPHQKYEPIFLCLTAMCVPCRG